MSTIGESRFKQKRLRRTTNYKLGSIVVR